MLRSDHPDDELLSALASGDTDARDPSLTGHLEGCARCTAVVDELGALRTSLADLPDLAPPRPLRLLPDVAPQPADRLGTVVRRLFAPVLTAGAALALVGMVGTAAPALSGAQAGGAAAASPAAEVAPSSQRDSLAAASQGQRPAVNQAEGGELDGTASERAVAQPPASAAPSPVAAAEGNQNGYGAVTAAQPSPWPMLIFTGIAVMVAAALLRWILVPRAG